MDFWEKATQVLSYVATTPKRTYSTEYFLGVALVLTKLDYVFLCNCELATKMKSKMKKWIQSLECNCVGKDEMDVDGDIRCLKCYLLQCLNE